MGFISFIHTFFIISLISFSSLIFAQQPYAGKATTKCDNTDNSTSVLGYTCNGIQTSCKSYLIFRSKPPHNTVSSISSFLNADPSQVSQINLVSETATFESDKEVIVPVSCSCSGGEYYQANASYVVNHEDTYFLIASDTFQGLSTCQALQNQNSNMTMYIYSGTTIHVPLRCACPTKRQSESGVKYLLSYLITWGDYVSSISTRFGVSIGMTLEANGLSENAATIYPFTTLLLPLLNPPSSTHTLVSPSPPPPPPSGSNSPSSTNKSSKNKTWVFVLLGAVGGAALVLCIGGIVFCLFFRKPKRKADHTIASESYEAGEKPVNKEVEESQEFLDSISSIAQSLKVYSYEEMQSATDDFSPTCLIEGSVYRGKFNGDFAAIKKMNGGDVSKEITLLNKINHTNLIRLSGVCFNDGRWFLVYEYAVNGPLHDWIYTNNSDGKFLNWTQRVQIVTDVATGLNYLHSYAIPPHVHKDLNSRNVLLDSDFRAKIANFGLARSAGQEGQFTLTKHIIGTKGYLAPEYLENGLVSTKLDIYAFGVLMLEILTGKEAAAFNRENTSVPEVLSMIHEEDGMDKLRDFIDPSLQGYYPLELAVLMIRVIKSCLTKDPADRSDMDEILQNLTRILNASLTWELSNNASTYQSFSQSS